MIAGSAAVDLLVPVSVTQLVQVGLPTICRLPDHGAASRTHGRRSSGGPRHELNRVLERVALQDVVIKSHTHPYPPRGTSGAHRIAP